MLLKNIPSLTKKTGSVSSNRTNAKTNSNPYSLSNLGWNGAFSSALSQDFPNWYDYQLGRVCAIHRGHIDIFCEQGIKTVAALSKSGDLAVGDWLLFDDDDKVVHIVERQSLFSRRGAGTNATLQLIAANVDTVFIVCSLNHNFNLSRIERYLALAKQAKVTPVVVLTKADLCEDSFEYVEQCRQTDASLLIEVVNSLDADSVSPLKAWCAAGKTVAFLGSSGVGKSTLVNTLMVENVLETNEARAQDSRGRHTTTARHLLIMPTGGLLLDTPGMRELQLTDCEQGVSETFDDIGKLALSCRFSDCQHDQEPGCAVQQALASGELTLRRLQNYQKLLAEQARNSASIAQKRAKDKQLHKMYRSAIGKAQSDKGRE